MTDKLDVIVGDAETYYSADFSLAKKQYPMWAYVHDEQFKVHMFGFKDSYTGMYTYCPSEKEAREYVGDVIVAGHRTFVAHNAFFDGAVLGTMVAPLKSPIHDTMTMARMLFSVSQASYSLSNLSKTCGAGDKIDGILGRSRGVRDLDEYPELKNDMRQYMKQDVLLCEQLYKMMLPHLTPMQIQDMEWSMRAFTDSPFSLDVAVLEQAALDEQDRISDVLAKAGVQRKELSSNPKFAELLRRRGVEPPMKLSKTTGKMTYAFAKTDAGLTALREHPDPNVVALVEGRLGSKGTLLETRIQSMLRVAEATPDNIYPVHLNSQGTHTGRVTGGPGGGGNTANLTTGSPLLYAIRPSNRENVVLEGDYAAIELRIARFMAADWSSIDVINNKGDLYKTLASKWYGVAIDEVTKAQRFNGKQGELSLQYGVSANALHLRLKSLGVEVTLGECEEYVRMFRDEVHPELKVFWYKTAGNILGSLLESRGNKEDSRPIVFSPTGPSGFSVRNGRIVFPSGRSLYYPDLHCVNVKRESKKGNAYTSTDYRYINARNAKRTGDEMARYNADREGWGADKLPSGVANLYGAAFFENLAQAMAAEVMTPLRCKVDVALRQLGGKCAVGAEIYDSIVCSVPHKHADKLMDSIGRAAVKPLEWWPELPLGFEMGIGENYGQAKEPDNNWVAEFTTQGSWK